MQENIIWLYPDAERNEAPRPYTVHSWPPVAGQDWREEETQTALDYPADEDYKPLARIWAYVFLFLGVATTVLGILLFFNIILPLVVRCYLWMTGC